MGCAGFLELVGKEQPNHINKMKPFVAVLAGVAVASAAPSADPHFLYGGYGGYGLVAPAVAAVDTGLIVSPSSGAVTPDFTDAQKEANPEIAEGSEAIVHPVIVGKRSAEPYYGYGGYAAVVPKIEPVDSGYIVVPSSGAVVPDFTAEQKEEAPEGPADSANVSIKKLAVTGHEVIHPAVHLIGKREADAYYGYGGYGGYGLLAPAVATVDTGLVRTGLAVTPDFTDAQKTADPAIADGSHPIKGVVVVGKREADAYYGYGGSGAVVPDFTAEQKEAAPEGPVDSANLSIKKLA